MKHTNKGLELTKNEIAALLGFAHDDPERANLYGVDFKLTDDAIRARAANGHIALDGVGKNETDDTGQWFVHRDFLKRAQKVLDGNDTLRLQFSGASLYDARISDSDGNERSIFSWAQDAANSQMSFPGEDKWDHLLRPPTGARQVRFITLNAQYLALLAKVAAAAETQGIDCYPPPKAEDQCVYRAEGMQTNTTWIAVIMPMRSDANDQSVEGAVKRFQEAADETGATVTMIAMDGTKTVLAEPKKKGRKAK